MSDKTSFVEQGLLFDGRRSSVIGRLLANQNLSILLTIRARFVSYAARFKSIQYFSVFPAFSNLFL